MPVGNKIAVFGIGRISEIIFSGTAALTFAEAKNEKSVVDFDMLKIAQKPDCMTLVKAYKKVQRKYYPQKDIFKSVK